MKTMAVALVSFLVAGCLAPSLAAEEASLIGHWEGALILVAAEQEVDVVVDFDQTAGQVSGQVQFPVTSARAQSVENFRRQGSRVNFSVHDTSGVESAFEGDLSPDGTSLQGTLKESGRLMSFTLHKVKVSEPVQEIPVYKLSVDGIELKNAFNADVGKVRMLLLLNPISFPSRMALRIVERYVMEKIGDPNLRVYVVWMAPNRPEAAKVVQHLAALAPDSRITHFWSTDKSLGQIFEPMVAFYKPISIPCLVFAPNRSWTASAPLPDRFRQTSKIDKKDSVNLAENLNGIALAADVQALLKKE
jgi:hypothetical protein